MTTHYYKMNCDNIFCRCPLHPWQQFLVSILTVSRVAHLLFRLHLGVAQWKQQYLDGCRVDSIQAIPALQQIPSRVAHLLCGLHPTVAKQKQQSRDGGRVDSIRGNPALQ